MVADGFDLDFSNPLLYIYSGILSKETHPMTENKTSDAQLRAVKKYKEKTKKMSLDFAPTEMNLWEHIQNQPIKKQTYIKNLIRADMNKGEA
jgi:hypothetical protein